MNDVIYTIRERAKTQLKTIVLPEFQDARIREAAEIIEKEGIARILLLEPDRIDAEKREKYSLEKIEKELKGE